MILTASLILRVFIIAKSTKDWAFCPLFVYYIQWTATLTLPRMCPIKRSWPLQINGPLYFISIPERKKERKRTSCKWNPPVLTDKARWPTLIYRLSWYHDSSAFRSHASNFKPTEDATHRIFMNTIVHDLNSFQWSSKLLFKSTK